MANQFKYINGEHIGDDGTVTIRYKKSDNSTVEGSAVEPSATIFPEGGEYDARALRWLREDTLNFLEV